jgi:hypothetical protein
MVGKFFAHPSAIAFAQAEMGWENEIDNRIMVVQSLLRELAVLKAQENTEELQATVWGKVGDANSRIHPESPPSRPHKGHPCAPTAAWYGEAFYHAVNLAHAQATSDRRPVLSGANVLTNVSQIREELQDGDNNLVRYKACHQ